MDAVSGSLTSAALIIGLIHTAAGPDHYLPFVAMSRIGRWSLRKTVTITLLCGAAHVLASTALAFVGIGLGLGLNLLNQIESTRGDLAGWLLIGFGVAYTSWGIRRALRNRPHTHLHVHADGTVHRHAHTHERSHLHVHAPTKRPAIESSPEPRSAVRSARGESLTPWILFTIFLFGPCEALIPLVMIPAAKGNLAGAAWVACLFGMVTLATMTTIVAASCAGLRSVRIPWLDRFGQAVAGAILLGCGVAVTLGL